MLWYCNTYVYVLEIIIFQSPIDIAPYYDDWI